MATEIKIVWFSNTNESTAEAEKTLGELLSNGWEILFVAGTAQDYTKRLGTTKDIAIRHRAAGFALLEKRTGGGGNIR